MDGLCYGKHTDVEGKPLGGLTVIVPMLQRMGVENIIDQHLPADPQADFAHGKILSVLIAARAHQPVALSNLRQWAKDTGANFFFDMPLEKMNDDRFGRSLDAFFKQRHSILAAVSLQVFEAFGIPVKDLHYDPTHILFTGVYEQAEARDGASDVDAKGRICTVCDQTGAVGRGAQARAHPQRAGDGRRTQRIADDSSRAQHARR